VAIPDYESCMMPLLKLLVDGEIHTMKELTHLIADGFNLSDEERTRMLPSGQQAYINNRSRMGKVLLEKSVSPGKPFTRQNQNHEIAST
jgi:restriction system protein